MPPKLWFRLQRLKAVLARGADDSSPNAPTHRMCPHCRALVERKAATCPFCGLSLGSPRARETRSRPGRVMGGVLPVPTTATSVLVAINIALYGICWYLTQVAASSQLQSAPAMGGISGMVLLHLGAKFGPSIYLQHQWWRLVTADFLHASLLHIIFNLWVLFDLGPAVEGLFSTPKFVVLYLVTGVCGFFASLVWSPTMSVGASASILGLIGILIGASFHHGSYGRDMRSMLWRWLIYIAIFGLLFSADNAAHAGGLISGMALGYVVSEGEPYTQADQNLWNLLALSCVLIIAGSFGLMALHLTHLLN